MKFTSTIHQTKPFQEELNELQERKFDFSNNPIYNFTSYEINYIYRIHNIRQILPWFIVTFGLIGNLFILLIFLKRKNRIFNSNAFCFCALAISDSVALIFMFLRSLIKLNILSNLTLSCKLIKFIYHSSLQFSSWCLVLLTLDRLIAVLFIFSYKKWSRKFYVILILIAILISIILINLHLIIYTQSLVKKPDMFDYTTTRAARSKLTTKKTPFKPKYACGVDTEKYPLYSKYFYSKWDIYHGIIYGALPFIIIFTSNIIIIFKLTFLKNQTFTKTKINQKLNISTRSLDKIDKSFKSTQITIMLLSVAFLFLAFTSPISIYMSIFYPNLTSMKEIKKEYIKVILRYFGYFNNAINFYVYVCLSSEFRKEFIDLIRMCINYRPISSTVSKCTTSTSLPSINNIEMKPLPPRTKPIVRKGLKFDSKKNYEITDDYLDSDKPFIMNSTSQDAFELYKKNNRNAKLIFYKKNIKENDNLLSTSTSTSGVYVKKNDRESDTYFINNNSTHV